MSVDIAVKLQIRGEKTLLNCHKSDSIPSLMSHKQSKSEKKIVIWFLQWIIWSSSY